MRLDHELPSTLRKDPRVLSTKPRTRSNCIVLGSSRLFGEAPPCFHGRIFRRPCQEPYLMLNALSVPRQTSSLEAAVQWLAPSTDVDSKNFNQTLASAVGQQAGEWKPESFLAPCQPCLLSSSSYASKGKLPHVSTKGFCQ